MQIEVISVSVNSVPTAKGSYQVAEIAYKDLKDGKVNGKKIMSFTNKNVYSTVSTAKQGDRFEIQLEKDDKGYWQWKSIGPVGSAPVSSSQTGGNVSPKSTYETPEERKIRQDYIIRQSSLSTAVAMLKTDKTSPKTEDVLSLAEQFVSFVYGKEPTNSFNDMSDDIPM